MTTTYKNRRTKKAQLIKLLSAKSGCDIQSLSDKLGWQPHTTRAALSGLRKAGYQVSREEPAKGGPAKYRILPTVSVTGVVPVEAAHHGT